jgi:hypothetical protein
MNTNDTVTVVGRIDLVFNENEYIVYVMLEPGVLCYNQSLQVGIANVGVHVNRYCAIIDRRVTRLADPW